MKINLITNLDNEKGLEQDYQILRSLLSGWGHEVHGVHFMNDDRAPAADMNLFLEVVVPRFFDAAPRQWVVPNPEWWFEQYTAHMHRFDAVLCKTPDAMRTFSRLTRRAHLVGFESADNLDESVQSEPSFLHVFGGSIVKGTRAIIDAWRDFKIPYPLTIVGDPRSGLKGFGNVRFVGRLPDEGFRVAQNRCLFHLCPSEYEGWGHSTHEALGVGAVVLTTSAPPMSETSGCDPRLHVTSTAGGQLRLGKTWKVTPEGVRDAVERCMAMGQSDWSEISQRARMAFEAERDQFRASLRRLLQ